MPGNDVRRSHSSVRTTIKQCSGNPQQLLSKCQHQPRQQSLKATKLKDFVLCLSRPHFPQALSGTWQQVTWQPLLYKMANGIISEYRWIFFFKPAVSPAPLPTPTPSLPPSQPKGWENSTLGLAILLSSAPWWPRLEHHRYILKSAAQLHGKSHCGKGRTYLLNLFSKKT